MFLKAITPTLRDTVIVSSAQNTEITRFSAIWRRPDRLERKQWNAERLSLLTTLETAERNMAHQAERNMAHQAESGMEAFTAAAAAVDEHTHASIQSWLSGWENLLDDADQPVAFSQKNLTGVLAWQEYAAPIAESLTRLMSGSIVDQAAEKNVMTPDTGGPPEPEPAA